MKEKGYDIRDNTVYQDNISTIKMLNNNRNSCMGNSRHIHVRFFFVKYRIDKGEFKVMYCPTKLMLADYFTKPLVGTLFKEMRSVIMGNKPIDEMNPLFLEKIKEYVGILYQK